MIMVWVEASLRQFNVYAVRKQDSIAEQRIPYGQVKMLLQMCTFFIQ